MSLRRHPLRAVYLSVRWWRWTKQPPWRQRASGLLLINPAPLDRHALAGLMTKTPVEDDE